MNPQSKEFKKLQAVWDKKLKSSGFDDAEQRDGNLKEWHSFKLVKPSHDKVGRADIAATAEYYRLCGHFLHSYKFKSLAERQIWELHCEGKSIKEFRTKEIKSKWKVYQLFHRLVK